MSDRNHTSRLSAYKNAGIGTTDLRRKRAELSVALRKQARDEQLLKRRALSPDAKDDDAQPVEKLPSPSEIVKGLKSSDLSVMTSSARAARRILSREQNPPITVMVSAGVIPPLVAALERDDCMDLQFEAAWALTNIASGTSDHTRAVVDGGAIPKLVTLLARGGSVGEQSAWALGNIAGDGPEPRDAVLRAAALPALLPSMALAAPPSTLRTAVWTYSNFCRYRVLVTLLARGGSVGEQSAWALGNIAGDGPEPRDAVLRAAALPALLPSMALAAPPSTLRTAVWTYSNFCRYRVLVTLLARGGSVGEQSAWALGNIAGDGPEPRDAVLRAAALPALLPSMALAAPPSTLRTAVWTYSNFCRYRVLVTLLARGGSVGEQSAWALGNIAGDGPEPRDAVLRAAALPALLPSMALAAPPSTLRTAVWTYSNFCRYRVLVTLLARGGSVGEQSAWALGNIAGDGPEPRDAVLRAAALPALLPSMALAAPPSTLRTAVWTYSNFCRYRVLVTLLARGGSVGEQSAWALGNIAGDGPEPRDAVLRAAALPALLPSMALAAPPSTLRTAVWTYSNFCRYRVLVTLLARGGSVGEQSAWPLGNIAGDGPEPRDAVLRAAALPALLPSMALAAPPSTLRTAVWTYSNFCRYRVLVTLLARGGSVGEQSAWALGNIAGDGPEPRDAVLRAAALPALLPSMALAAPPSTLRTAVWTYSNFCRYRVLVTLLARGGSVGEQSAWALGNIAGDGPEPRDAVLRAAALPALLPSMALAAPPSTLRTAVWTYSNFCRYRVLVTLLARGGSVGEQSAWALGNIAGDGPEPRDAVLRAAALPALLPSMALAAPPSTLRTAVWTYSNFCRYRVLVTLLARGGSVGEQSAWALGNIAGDGPEPRDAVLRAAALPALLPSMALAAPPSTLRTAVWTYSNFCRYRVLVTLLARGGSVGEQSAWALGNIAGDGPEPRDAVLRAAALPALLPSMALAAPPSTLRTAVWTYSNFCRYRVLVTLLARGGSVGEQSAWALGNIAGDGPEPRDAVLRAAALPALLPSMALAAPPSTLRTAVWTYSNFCRYRVLVTLLARGGSVGEQSAWALGNIAGDGPEPRDAVLRAAALPALLPSMALAAPPSTLRTAVWTYSNFCRYRVLVTLLARGGSVGEQSAWALGNIAGDGPEPRDAVLRAAALPALLPSMALAAPPSTLRTAVWTYSNFCRYRVLVTLLARGGSVGEQSAWALGNIAGDGPEPRDAVLRAAVLPSIALAAPPSTLRTAVWTYSNFCRYRVLVTLLARGGSVGEQSAWALGNIAGDGPEPRDAVLRAVVLPSIALAAPPSTLRTAVWTYSNFCRYRVLVTLLARGGSVGEQSAWALGNIAGDGPEPRDAVLRAAALPALLPSMALAAPPSTLRTAVWTYSNFCRYRVLVTLLARGGSVGEQSAWALGNIAGDGPEPRDAVLRAAALPALLPSIALAAPPSTLRTAVWTYSNFCRYRVLVTLLARGGSVGEQSAWALGNIAGDGPEPRDAVLRAAALPALLPSMALAAPPSTLRTAVWTYSNFCRYRVLVTLLARGGSVGEQSAWALGNIAGDGPEPRDAVLRAAALPALLPSIALAAPPSTLRTAVWTYSNFCRYRVLVTLLARGGSVGEQSAWALGNIAGDGPEPRDAVLRAAALPALLPSMALAAPPSTLRTAVWTYSNFCRYRVLVTLLARGGSVGEQSAWALGNIAGDGPEPRDAVLRAAALPALLPSMALAAPPSTLRTAVWTYSNFCRNKNPIVNFELVAPALPFISDLLEVQDADVLADACWAISYLTDGPNERIEEVQLTSNLLPRVVKLLDHKAAAVKTPALRAAGNMLTGSDEQTDRCLEAGCISYLLKLLGCGKTSLVKEAAWAASNILAGTQIQIQRAIDQGMLPKLIYVLAHEDAKCQKEAAWAITNLCLGGSPAQLDALISAGFLEPYCSLLGAADHRAVTVVLDGLTNLLQAAEKYGQVEPLCIKLEEIGALDKIEALQSHENEQVYKKTLHILDTYFAENEDQTAAPEATSDEYQFGTTNGDQPNINF